MRHPAGEEDDGLKKLRAEASKMAEALRRAMENSQPVFKVAVQHMKMAADNLRRSLQVFGAELNKAMEKWSKDEGDDGIKTGAKK